MTDTKKRSLTDRLRELLEALKESLNPRQPVPIPIPVREQLRRR